MYFRFRGTYVNLLTQCFDKRAQVVKLSAIFRRPDGAQQFGVRYGNPLIPHQQRQQLELGRCEVDHLPLPVEPMAINVKFQVASLQQWAG
jgi:hypothetical protein